MQEEEVEALFRESSCCRSCGKVLPKKKPVEEAICTICEKALRIEAVTEEIVQSPPQNILKKSDAVLSEGEQTEDVPAEVAV